MKAINLNADMGESFGAYTIGDDEAILDSVKSANIACGFHAGDPVVMQETVKNAIAKGVSLGAHPGFPDLQGFGRRPMNMALSEVYAMTIYQVGALMGMAQSQGGKVTHVKPHGALNNMACEDADLSDAICKAVKDIDKDLIFLAPALSELSSAAKRAGLCVAEEIFADRAYTDTGTLVSRKIEGSVIHDAETCLARVLEMVEKGALVSIDGKVLPTPIHSICVHGDTPQACESAAFILKGLKENGLDVLALDEMNIGSAV
ncbi:5-oxoprolinase subunit PxpA [Terasakiella sp. A23]|uniref:LamB/YcsF family protein n=1 Tax=Terasakiella sp. FCG-A23 TaxID=3080561 RepID=UPI00295594BE|nr:5-oxoprolinase subunit PxpA [Terasakiella sp. A23]MDV7339172.1 5-oxoprolinase subunit PxpA [Terasakiella sp. A23]